MKNILLIAFLILSNMFYTQNMYEIDLKEAKDYVDIVFRKDSSRIENYVKLSDGRIMRSKTDNPIEEFDNDWSMFYKIIKKDDKIIFISKSPDMWGGIGDSRTDYNYYFNSESVLVGAEKKIEFFIKDTKCAEVVKYFASYLNDNQPKLLKVESIKDYNGKLINLDSPKCRNSKKDILESIEDLEKINFRDVEGFMKTEKIKYYRTEKKNSSVGNLIRGNKTATQENGDDGSKIGIDRKLVEFIPGTVGRGGSKPSQTCSAGGSINIAYTVDKEGNVISARRSSGVSNPCIVSTSISWVKQYVKAEKSTTSSRGIYMITF